MKKPVVIILILAFIMSITCAASDISVSEELTDLFRYAEYVYTWFEYGFDNGAFIGSYKVFNDREYHEARPWETEPGVAESFTADGNVIYNMVKVEEINTKAKMKSFLMTIFAESTVNRILSKTFDGHGYFVEKDGYLYVPSSAYITGAGDNRYGGYTDRELTVIKEDGGKITVRMTFTPVDGNADFKECDYQITYDYVLVKQNGNPVFENFITMRDLYLQSGVTPPKTADSSVYITAAAGVIALCCAVAAKKKIKE